MTVYVLTRGFEYEGEMLRAVYSSKELAERGGVAIAEEDEPVTWVESSARVWVANLRHGYLAISACTVDE